MRMPTRTPRLGRTWKPATAGESFQGSRLSMAAVPPDPRYRTMKWETPQAIDTRFGFEITMYISTR